MASKGIVSWRLAWLLTGVLCFAGCASPRLKKFQEFAEAGTASARASQTVYAEAGVLTADADTYILMKTRADLDSEARMKQIVASNSEVTARVKVLNDLSAHAAVLAAYFGDLAKLAGADAPASTGVKLSAVATNLQAIGGSLRGSSVGDQQIADFIGRAGTFVLSRHQVAALDAEFRRRAPLIEREIELQTAALKAVRVMMEEDLEILKDAGVLVDVIKPYVTDADLPEGWHAARTEVLTGRRSIAAAGAAIKASEALKEAYLKLVKNELSHADIQMIAQEANEAIAALKPAS